MAESIKSLLIIIHSDHLLVVTTAEEMKVPREGQHELVVLTIAEGVVSWGQKVTWFEG